MKRMTGTTRGKAAAFVKCCKANTRTSAKVKARSPQAVYGSPSSQIGKTGQLINGKRG